MKVSKLIQKELRIKLDVHTYLVKIPEVALYTDADIEFGIPAQYGDNGRIDKSGKAMTNTRLTVVEMALHAQNGLPIWIKDLNDLPRLHQTLVEYIKYMDAIKLGVNTPESIKNGTLYEAIYSFAEQIVQNNTAILQDKQITFANTLGSKGFRTIGKRIDGAQHTPKGEARVVVAKGYDRFKVIKKENR